MDIQPPRLPSSAASTTSASATSLQALRIGQQLVAQVIEQLPTRNDVLIQLGSQQVRANSEIPLLNQQQLKLEVVKLENPLTLRVLEMPTRAQDLAALALRKLLPLQQPIQHFNQSLLSTQQLLATQPQSSNRLLDQINVLNQRLINQTPSSVQLSHPVGVKAAIMSSGIFLESRLAQGKLQLTVPTITASVVSSRSDMASNTAASAINSPAVPTRATGQIQGGEAPLSRSTPDMRTTSSPATTSGSDVSPRTSTAVIDSTNPAPSTGGRALEFGSAPLSRIDTKANLVRLISVLKSWPGLSDSGASGGLTRTASSSNLQAQNQTQANRAGVPNTIPQVLTEQLRTLLTQSESALAKIVINQLAASSHDEGNRLQWQMELPALHHGQGQSVLMKIERDSSQASGTNEQPTWRVSLELDPPNLGRIRCQLSMQNDQLNTEFWADKPRTLNLIRQHIPSFRNQLQDAKLLAQKIMCSPGAGPQVPAELSASPVLNEKA